MAGWHRSGSGASIRARRSSSFVMMLASEAGIESANEISDLRRRRINLRSFQRKRNPGPRIRPKTGFPPPRLHMHTSLSMYAKADLRLARAAPHRSLPPAGEGQGGGWRHAPYVKLLQRSDSENQK